MTEASPAEARASAGAAAERLGVRVERLHDLGEQSAAVDLLCRIWRATPDQVLNVNTVRALAYSGNYVVGAYRGGLLVGTAVGFLGEGHLHSHITGVAPGQQGVGVGFALKQDQRAWCLEHGIDTVRWTFDPLVRRNAYFNLQKLAGTAEAYLPDFYGPMTDGVNAGDASDRIYLRWDLATPAAVTAAAGTPVEVSRGLETLAVEVPEDIEELRERDRAAANRWRYAVREAMIGALDDGYRITGITRDGYYLLERG